MGQGSPWKWQCADISEVRWGDRVRLGLGIRQTWHRQDRTFGRGYGIGSSPSNRSRHLATFGSSFNIPLREYIDYLSPLPTQNDGGNDSHTALFISFVFPTFWPLPQAEERGSGKELLVSSQHRTRTSHDGITTHIHKHTHTLILDQTKEIFPTWMDFQISLALSGSAGNLSAQEERREKTTVGGEAGATRCSGQRRARPAHETGVSPEQRGGEIIMDGMDARG